MVNAGSRGGAVVQPGNMIRAGVKRVEAIRKAVGDEFDIAVDAQGRCTTAMAIDFCSRHLVDYIQPDVCHAGETGLGITLNEKVAAAHRYKPAARAEIRLPDGSVTDQ